MSDEDPSITVLVLAAGRSTRFGKPKQFEEFAHPVGRRVRQMWEQSIHGLKTRARVHLVLRKGWQQQAVINIRDRTSTTILEVPHSNGQAHTLHQALCTMEDSFSRQFQDVLVVNCDNGFGEGVLDDIVDQGRMTKLPIAAVVAQPETAEDRFSWIDGYPHFVHASEKVLPSVAAELHRHPRSGVVREGFYGALAGAYYFPHTPSLRMALGMVCHAGPTEPYLSMAYSLIDGRKRGRLLHADQWHDWGTPEALRREEIREMALDGALS